MYRIFHPKTLGDWFRTFWLLSWMAIIQFVCLHAVEDSHSVWIAFLPAFVGGLIYLLNRPIVKLVVETIVKASFLLAAYGIVTAILLLFVCFVLSGVASVTAGIGPIAAILAAGSVGIILCLASISKNLGTK